MRRTCTSRISGIKCTVRVQNGCAMGRSLGAALHTTHYTMHNTHYKMHWEGCCNQQTSTIATTHGKPRGVYLRPNDIAFMNRVFSRIELCIQVMANPLTLAPQAIEFSVSGLTSPRRDKADHPRASVWNSYKSSGQLGTKGARNGIHDEYEIPPSLQFPSHLEIS